MQGFTVILLSLTLAQMPQPIHNGSEILAILLVGSTSIQSFPVNKKRDIDPFSCLKLKDKTQFKD